MGRGDGSGWGSGCGLGMGSGKYKGKMERTWFPAMPMPMAIVCCVLNFIIPGLGTAIAGLSVFFCSRNEDLDAAAKMVSCFTSCGIGFLQLLTAVLLLIGWFWSCFWGVTFIMMSVEYYHSNNVDDYDSGTAVTITVPSTHVVYQNGSANPTAVIVQPSFVPYRVAQPVAQMVPQPGPSIIMSQPLQPPPYTNTSGMVVSPGIYPSASMYPDAPIVRQADGSEQKVGL